MESETVIVEPTQSAPVEPPDMEAVRAYFTALQLDLTARVRAIEVLLGFAEGVEALGTRVHKLEIFVFGAK